MENPVKILSFKIKQSSILGTLTFADIELRGTISIYSNHFQYWNYQGDGGLHVSSMLVVCCSNVFMEVQSATGLAFYVFVREPEIG